MAADWLDIENFWIYRGGLWGHRQILYGPAWQSAARKAMEGAHRAADLDAQPRWNDPKHISNPQAPARATCDDHYSLNSVFTLKQDFPREKIGPAFGMGPTEKLQLVAPREATKTQTKGKTSAPESPGRRRNKK